MTPPITTAAIAMGIRRRAGERAGVVSGISFVILQQIRLCRGLYYGRSSRQRARESAARWREWQGRAARCERQVMSNKMWGGRFSERPDAIMEEINVSIDVDRHLYAQDIAASKDHTARSRNDQVATDFRLFVRDTIDQTDAALAAFQQALVERAIEHAATVMPGFTHL